MENLKIVMKAEVELRVPNTASVEQRKQLIQDLRAVILPTLARFQTHGVQVGDCGAPELLAVHPVAVRVTGDSINSVRA